MIRGTRKICGFDVGHPQVKQVPIIILRQETVESSASGVAVVRGEVVVPHGVTGIHVPNNQRWHVMTGAEQ